MRLDKTIIMIASPDSSIEKASQNRLRILYLLRWPCSFPLQLYPEISFPFKAAPSKSAHS